LTTIKFKKGAKVHMEIRGGWPGYLDCLSTNEKQQISGINISGGSLLGIESTTGIIAESLKSNKYKYWLGFNGAIIYSGNLLKNKIYPDKNLGRFAFNQSDKYLYNGQVGAGLSASHGQGWAYKKLEDGSEILALVVNNAVGSVYKNDELVHNPKGNKQPWLPMKDERKNTTIIVVITTLELDNDELKQMNQQLNVTIGETIRPFNTFSDGDIFYTCSTQKMEKKYNYWNRIKFFVECSAVLKEAIHNTIL
jgi:L-aminopeptidase/D-esterase-like protein